MMPKCEYPKCNSPMVCFHYCHEHHVQVCENGESLPKSEAEKPKSFDEWWCGYTYGGVLGDEGKTEARDAWDSAIASSPSIEPLVKALEVAEQTIRNLGNGFLTGDAQQIALNEAANLRAALSAFKGEEKP